MEKEIQVKCPDCNDIFHTKAKLGEMEGCTLCKDVFIIEQGDIIT